MVQLIADPWKKSGTRTSCPKPVKETVWRKYNGNRMSGKCYVCKAPILFTNFEVGHNKPHSKGGKWTVDNCRAICRACNRSMGKKSLEAFKDRHFTKKKSVKKTTKKRSRPKPLITPIKIPRVKIPRLRY